MGLLNQYSAANRVVTNDKTVTYSMKHVSGQWSYKPFPWQEITYNRMWEYHRYCMKTYSYVGMDLATANACATAMIAKYTRDFYVSEWLDNGEWSVQLGGTIPMAEVTVQQREGCMYDVLVNVREDDARMTKQPVAPSSLFSAENARDYDNS